MKRTVLTSITAIICVVLVSLSLKDGITKVADAKIEAASVAAEAAKYPYRVKKERFLNECIPAEIETIEYWGA